MDLSSTTPRHSKTYDDFPITFILEDAFLLLEYKTRAQRENREGAPGCSSSKLHDQILNVLYLFGEEVIAHWDNLVTASSEFAFCDEQLSMGGPKKEYLEVEVLELDPPQPFGTGKFSSTSVHNYNQPTAVRREDYVQLGTTRLDVAFIKFSTKNLS